MECSREQVLKKFICTDRLHHKLLERQGGKCGLHRSQHAILLYLKFARAPVNQKELAEHFEISSSAVTSVIKRLEANGYIERSSDTADMRKNVIKLSEKGDGMLKKSKKLVDEVDSIMFEGFSDRELNDFYGCLEKIYSNLERIDNDNGK